ncbi:MAG: hypothetical protein R2932_23985 [Caldilineaceae bacterium]
MAGQDYAKLFYDIDAAKLFASEIDRIATSSKAMVSVTSSKKEDVILCRIINPYAEAIGDYYVIDKDGGTSGAYYVRYAVQSPRNSSRADFELAKRFVASYLDKKYQELGPDAGITRG